MAEPSDHERLENWDARVQDLERYLAEHQSGGAGHPAQSDMYTGTIVHVHGLGSFPLTPVTLGVSLSLAALVGFALGFIVRGRRLHSCQR